MANLVAFDAHYHAAPDFGFYWRHTLGYDNVNMVAETVKTLGRRDRQINTWVVALLSDAAVNEGVHNRYMSFLNEAERTDELKLPEGFSCERFTDNSFVVNYKNKNFIFTTGQVINVREPDQTLLLSTFGSHSVPNGKNAYITMVYLLDRGLPRIAPLPLCNHQGGMGKKRLEYFLSHGALTAVEFNPKLLLPGKLARVPVLGGYSESANESARSLAKEYERPFIPASDSDTIENAGLSYFYWPESRFDPLTSHEDLGLIKGLTEIINSEEFVPVEAYMDFSDWFNLYVKEIKFREGLLKSKRKWEKAHNIKSKPCN